MATTWPLAFEPVICARIALLRKEALAPLQKRSGPATQSSELMFTKQREIWDYLVKFFKTRLTFKIGTDLC